MARTVAPPDQLIVCIRTAEREVPVGEIDGWQVQIEQRAWIGPGEQLHVRATWHGDKTTRAGLVLRCPVGPAVRVLVPAVFYGDNGAGGVATRYPRLGPLDPATFTAPCWDFASERTASPAVFLWTATGCKWLATTPGGTGVGFRLDPDAAELRAHFPGLDSPFTHDRLDEAPSLPLREIAPGQSIEATVWHGNADSQDSAAYAPVLRALHAGWNGATRRAVPRARLTAAAQAAAAGLLAWHYRHDPGVLLETVSFDGTRVREAMHVAWISGAPAAYALLRHGLEHNHEPSVTAGQAVLNTIAGGLAPCGAFWGLWTPYGWRAGWNGDPHKLHARTLAEATLFLLRACGLEPQQSDWRAAACSNLEFCISAMDGTGHPGSYYHAETGGVLDRRGTAGLLWAAALVEGWRVLGDRRYLDAAGRVGRAYTPAIVDGLLSGAPEDVGLCPSSEDGYNALLSTMALYQETGDTAWLALAQAAADWTLTFRWAYDVAFPPGSPLAQRGFRTQGADGASPSNHHLHPYGLICTSALRDLATATGDGWYASRAADHLACFLGEVALRDGAFGGAERRGMMSEQWYTAAWSEEGRAGEMAPVSHAWCLGLLLMASEDWLREPLSAQAGKSAATRKAPTPASPLRARPYRPPHPDRPHPVRLLPGLYQVGGGYLSHHRDAASYLLLDETSGASIMVDCGSHSGAEAVRENIGRIADIARVQLVIGTHSHWDHVEAYGHLRPELKAPFALHEADVRAVETGHPDLTCAGFLYNEPFHSFAVDLVLHGGERFNVGEYELRILHLPGHSPGGIGVLARFRRTNQVILIPGDAVAGAFSRFIRSSVPAWKRSVHRLMKEQIDFMVPNHLPPGAQTALLSDVPNRLARVYNQLQTDLGAFQDPQRTV